MHEPASSAYDAINNNNYNINNQCVIIAINLIL